MNSGWSQVMISAKVAAGLLLVGLGALAVFHILVLLGAFPSEMVWGGRAGGPEANLGALEAVALIVTTLFAGVVAAKTGYFGSRWTGRAVSVAMWVVFGYFALSVVANLLSSSSLERAIFTPVSAILAALALRLAMSK